MLMTCPSSPTSVFTDTGAQSADLFNGFGSWSLLQNGSAFSLGAENVAETGLHGTGCFPRVPQLPETTCTLQPQESTKLNAQ